MCLTAVGLIGAVLTVVLLIAGPAHGDAAAAGTGEEVVRTLLLLLLCGGQEQHRGVTQTVTPMQEEAF